MAHQDDGSAGIAVVCVLIALFLVGKANDDPEWAPEDDGVSVTKEVRLTDAAGLPGVVAALGGPVDKPPELPGGQAVVARVRWTSPDRASGTYQLVVLDNRTAPPRPLPVYVGWNARGELGEYWTGRYDELAERYTWLAGTESSAGAPPGEPPDRPWAVGAPATAQGSIGGVFLLHEGSPRFTDPARELLVVLFFVDASGEVRWARNV